MAGFGLSVRASSHAQLDLALFKQAVFRAKGDHDAFWLYSLCFRIGVQPARASERLDAGEVNVVAAFASKAGLQQFVAPFGVPKSGARTGDGSISRRWRALNLVEGLDRGSRTASTVNGPVTRTRLCRGRVGRRASLLGIVAMAASICSRVMPSRISGLFAMDFSVTCGTFL